MSKKFRSPISCDHANECPSGPCDCPPDCACREHMCKLRKTTSEKRAEKRMSDYERGWEHGLQAQRSPSGDGLVGKRVHIEWSGTIPPIKVKGTDHPDHDFEVIAVCGDMIGLRSYSFTGTYWVPSRRIFVMTVIE